MKKLMLLPCILLMSLAVVPAALAQTLDHVVLMSFDKPVEIPGQVLQPGTYMLVAPGSRAGFVQVFDRNRQKLFATFQSVTAIRPDATDGLQIKIGDDNGREALMGWFAPGETIGYELLYPGQQMKQLSATERSIPVGGNANPTANGD